MFRHSPRTRQATHCIVFPQELALDAVQTVAVDLGAGKKEIDIKNYAKVEKIPGGTIEDCRVLKGEVLVARQLHLSSQRCASNSSAMLSPPLFHGEDSLLD